MDADPGCFEQIFQVIVDLIAVVNLKYINHECSQSTGSNV